MSRIDIVAAVRQQDSGHFCVVVAGRPNQRGFTALGGAKIKMGRKNNNYGQ